MATCAIAQQPSTAIGASQQHSHHRPNRKTRSSQGGLKNQGLIVASNGGADRYPGWYHNLRKHPDVEINVGPKRFAVTARRVTSDDADYPRLWQIVNKNNAHGYEAYQRRTSRPIPVFVLTPAHPA